MVLLPGAAMGQTLGEAQARLDALGFPPGLVDGIMGPDTRGALRDFQQANGLPVTGLLDEATLAALFPLPLEEEAQSKANGEPAQPTEALEAARPSTSPLTVAPDEIPRAAASPAISNMPEEPQPIATENAVPLPAAEPKLTGASVASEAAGGEAPEISPTVMAAIAGGVLALIVGLARRRRRRRGVAAAMKEASGRAEPKPEAVPGSQEVSTPPAAQPDRPSPARRQATEAQTLHHPDEPRPVTEALAAPAYRESASFQGAAPAPLEERPAIAAANPNAQPVRRAPAQEPVLSPPPQPQQLRSLRQDPPAPTSQFTGSAKTDPTGWVRRGEDVWVAGRRLPGLVHVGRPPRGMRPDAIPNDLIDPALSVSKYGDDIDGRSLPYWPSYSGISPGARANYLDWLQGGAQDVRIGIGYVFLYFYGLERRFFTGPGDTAEREVLIEEVRNLLLLYGDAYAIRRYLGAFLEAASVVMDDLEAAALPTEPQGWELPLSLRIAIGRRLQAGEPIGAELALSWLRCHPETRLRTPASRAAPEFEALFKTLFQEAHPEGMKVRRPKRLLTLRYKAASADFEVDLTQRIGPLPDISQTRAPVDALLRLAETACDALDKFSRYLGRNPEGRGTVEAHALLPERIRDQFPCPELDALRDWTSVRIAEGGVIPIEDLVERLEGARPEKLGKKKLEGVADALANLGVGFAPDPRYALRAPKLGEPAVLFHLPDVGSNLEHTSPTYRATLLGVLVGAHVAHADGEVSAEERRALSDRIDAAHGLSPSERARLHANLLWAFAAPPAPTLFRKQVGEMPEDSRLALARLSAAVAAADGALDKAELGALEKIYRALGLDPSLLHGHLHEMMTGAQPVTVREARHDEPDFAIPPPPDAAAPPPSGLALDRTRIEAVMADTARVAGVLHDIFDDGDDEPEEIDAPAASDQDARFPGLAPAHARLAARLLDAPRWSEAEFDSFAGELGLMPAGALETLNEWAFDAHDDAFLEEDDGYEINPEVASRIAAAA